VRVFFHALWDAPFYTLFVAFLCAHPLGSGLVSLVGALRFRASADPRRWYVNRAEDLVHARSRYPIVSIVIPAHNEAEVIAAALRGVFGIRWPELDVIVVDDASTDSTRDAILPFLADERLRLLRKTKNEGKSMAINDALPICRGEVVLLMDADGVPAEDVLERMAPHLVVAPSVAAVTGNPRVLNTRTVLARLQAIEFSSIVSVQRRGDAAWGRLMTVSGLCVLFERDTVRALGGFAPDMATEDIDLTWRLQLTGHEVIYEPAAIFGMQAPETLGPLWRQRVRWVRGLAQVLRRHALKACTPANWRMWPVLVTSTLSIVWAHALVIATVFWVVSEPLGLPPPGIGQFLTMFAAITVLAGTFQALTGIWLDRSSDPWLKAQIPWVALYPLVYWILSVLLVVRGTLPGLIRKPTLSVWQIPRQDVDVPQGARSG
jgi:biofilm PGA synthesis N-glycosyltransferase PgaC